VNELEKKAFMIFLDLQPLPLCEPQHVGRPCILVPDVRRKKLDEPP
jgi:hypothetical protein